MKKGKIAVITACAVVLILGGIIGLSKVFETSWQNENTVENSLDAQIIENSEMKIDYPYTISEKSLTEEEYPNIISYQEAANIAGEAILYLSGVTEHQKVAGEIVLKQEKHGYEKMTEDYSIITGETIYTDEYLGYSYSNIIDLDLSNETCPKYIRIYCSVNAETGEIISIFIDDYSKYGQDYYKVEEQFPLAEMRELSQSETDNTLDYINQIVDVLGWECNPVAYSMVERGSQDGLVYYVNILFDNNRIYEFKISNEDGIVEKGSLLSVDWSWMPAGAFDFTYIN
ncbi:MAG: hypothetical protein IJ410_08090 [Oscillospiraceae bacterium]|nr:hypothetical protein [Oscillospiraceae bacterium]